MEAQLNAKRTAEETVNALRELNSWAVKQNKKDTMLMGNTVGDGLDKLEELLRFHLFASRLISLLFS